MATLIHWYRARDGLRWHCALPFPWAECPDLPPALLAQHAGTIHVPPEQMCRRCRRQADRYLGLIR